MKQLFLISLCVILGISGIFVGNPLTNNTRTITFVCLIISSIYILYKTIKDKEYKLIDNKMDIIMVLLTISSYISLIFNKYASMEGTIEYILRYTSILAIYFLVKEISRENEKLKKCISNTIILVGVIIFIFGIDNLTFNIFGNFLDKINIPNIIDNNDNRMISTFGYANSFCIAMVISFILSIFSYLKENGKILKKLYMVSIYISLIGIVLSYSRGGWLFASLAVVLIYISLEKEKKIDYIKVLVISIIGTIIYTNIFKETLVNKEFIIAWISLIIGAILVIILKELLTRCKTRKLKFLADKIYKFRYILILLLVIGVIIIIVVGLKLSKPLVLFQDKDAVDGEYSQRIYNVEPNKEYKIVLDIDAKQSMELVKNYEIVIEQKNYLYDTIDKVSEEFGNYTGIKEFNIQTTEDTTDLKITFKSKSNANQRGFIVKSLEVNGEEEILKYLYLPKGIVEKIQNFKLSDVSVVERLEFMKTGVLVGINNLWTGAGGDGFKYLEGTYQSYYYYTTEPHSYIVEIFAEFGILGLISFVLLVVFLIKQFIKDKKNKNYINIDIYIILIILLLHSMIDFNMSFMYIMMLFFIFVAMISAKEKEARFKRKSYIINILMISIILLNLYANTMFMLEKTRKEDFVDENINDILVKLEEEPYKNDLENIYKMINVLDTNENIDEYKEYIDKIYEELLKRENVNRFDIKYHINRLSTIKRIEEVLENKGVDEYLDIFKNLENSEIDYISNLLNDKRTRLDIEEKEKYKNILESS